MSDIAKINELSTLMSIGNRECEVIVEVDQYHVYSFGPFADIDEAVGWAETSMFTFDNWKIAFRREPKSDEEIDGKYN